MKNMKQKLRSLTEVWLVSTKLGLTSFGGPIAHLGYFREEYVTKRKWMDDKSYADLVALCQLLPGPASSQVGIGIGIVRSGLLGGIIAWLGFTLPSIVALVAFALLMQGLNFSDSGWIHGLKLVAVAIVAQAVLGMGQKLTPDRSRITLAVIAAAVTLLWQTSLAQVLVIVVAGVVGVMLYQKSDSFQPSSLFIPISQKFGAACLILFFTLLFGLPWLRQYVNYEWLGLLDSFYRAGSLVFGGGHVVLPLLEREVVPSGLVSSEAFLTGYGATQAVPGPLFTFAGYLGAIANGIPGAVIATIGIFLPAFLLIIGTLPFWNRLRENPRIGSALAGINAAVVGILLAALYHPIWTSAVRMPADFVIVILLFVLLVFWKIPPWIVVILGAAGGLAVNML